MVKYCIKQLSGAFQRIVGGTYNDNNFDSKKNSNTINALPYKTILLLNKKRLA